MSAYKRTSKRDNKPSSVLRRNVSQKQPPEQKSSDEKQKPAVVVDTTRRRTSGAKDPPKEQKSWGHIKEQKSPSYYKSSQRSPQQQLRSRTTAQTTSKQSAASKKKQQLANTSPVKSVECDTSQAHKSNSSQKHVAAAKDSETSASKPSGSDSISTSRKTVNKNKAKADRQQSEDCENPTSTSAVMKKTKGKQGKSDLVDISSRSSLYVASETLVTPLSQTIAAQPANNMEQVIANIQTWAKSVDQLTLDDLVRMYNSLPAEPYDFECSDSHLKENAMKNRYSDVYCLNSTRVKLHFPSWVKDDYIHANRVTNMVLKVQMIVAQGPLSSTIYEFWRMIWQEGTTSIVMLCNYVEDNRKKCSPYFSPRRGVVVPVGKGGVLQVKTLKIDDDTPDGIKVTTLEVTHNGQTRKVSHIQFKNWPDFQTPSTNLGVLFRLLKMVRDDTYPVVVHCSAGIGRSGTLVALELCLMELIAGKQLDIPTVVRSLRACRAQCVQTLDQFICLYKAILQFALDNEYISSSIVDRFHNALK